MKPEWSYARGVEEEPSEHSFYNTDTEELYEKNLKENYDQLKENGWLSIEEDQIEKFYLDKGYNYYLYTPDKPVLNDWVKLSYQLNSYGFRCEEMPNEKKPRSIITIGCSNTFGIGMPVGQIWPTLVGNTLRHRPYNLGICAGSHDSAFRVLLSWLPKIRPSHVFFLEPPGVRYETQTNSMGFHMSSIHAPDPVAMRFETEGEWILSREKTMRAIKSLCDQFETPFYHTHQDNDDEFFTIFDNHDLARDLMHAGRKRHIFWAMKFLKMAGHEWEFKT